MPEITCSQYSMQDGVSSHPRKAGAFTEQFQQHMEAWWLTQHQPSPHGKVQQIKAGKAAGLEPFSVFSSQLGVVLCGLCRKKPKTKAHTAQSHGKPGQGTFENARAKAKLFNPPGPTHTPGLGLQSLSDKIPIVGHRAEDCGIHYHNKSL